MAHGRRLGKARLDSLRRRLEEERSRILAVLRTPTAASYDGWSEPEEVAQRTAEQDGRVEIADRERALLAEVAAARGDLDGAGVWLGHGLGHADALVARTRAPADRGQLDVLLFAAQLRVLARAPIPFDLAVRLVEASERLARQRDPAFRTYQRWFEIYETLATAPAR